MAREAAEKDQDEGSKDRHADMEDEEAGHHRGSNSDTDEVEEEEEEEPKLKYTTLTKSLGPVYRNGDATSAFLVAGDKMV